MSAAMDCHDHSWQRVLDQLPTGFCCYSQSRLRYDHVLCFVRAVRNIMRSSKMQFEDRQTNGSQSEGSTKNTTPRWDTIVLSSFLS